ncbi:MAG: AMP-binding protein [Flavobacteriaceae bacterium]
MGDWNFAQVYEVVARKIPDAPALLQGARAVTWKELDGRAENIAAYLVSRGISRQAKITQYLYNCPEYLESMIGGFKASLVSLNTNYRYGPDELTYLWNKMDVSVVVFHGTFSATIDAMRSRVPEVKVWLWVDHGEGECPAWAIPYDEAASYNHADVWRPWALSGDDVLILCTGGTTGTPKGVMWRQDDLFVRLNTENGDSFPDEADYALQESLVSTRGRPYLAAAPLMHGAGLFTALLTLSRGGAISLLEKRHFDPIDLLDTVERDEVGSLMWIGDAFARPVLDALRAFPDRWNLSSLRVIISTGVVFSAEVKAQILEYVPKAVISDVFGASETMSVGRSISKKDEPARTATFKAKATTRVFNERDEDVVPGSGERGMLAIGGRQPIGYYNDAEKGAQIFRTIRGERFVIPGDWATIERDGTVTLIGRGSECINTGGEKVFPEEVEVVIRRHQDVFDAVVVGAPDARFGQVIVAIVQTEPDRSINAEQLISYVKTNISGYKAPRHVLVVDKIARLPNGKPDLTVLRKLAANRVPAARQAS